LDKACIALGSVNDGKAILLTAVSEDLVSRYHAGKLISELSQIMGARGGGKADLAQAGGGDPEKLSLALQRFQEIVS
jgi:alanyl-tRNA synthetase